MVPPDELTREHLIAEWKESVRLFNLVRRAQEKGLTPVDVSIPSEYKLGRGHVTFFYDKLDYLLDRREAIADEMRNRGYHPNPIPAADLIANIEQHWIGQYVPTEKALEINRERIALRLFEAEVRDNRIECEWSDNDNT